MSSLKQEFHEYLNENMPINQLDYLTVECSTRNKQTAKKCKKLLIQGNHAEALKKGDPIAYNVAWNDYQREHAKVFKPKGQ